MLDRLGSSYPHISMRVVHGSVHGGGQVVDPSAPGAALLHQSFFQHPVQPGTSLTERSVEFVRDLRRRQLALCAELVQDLQIEKAHRAAPVVLTLRDEPRHGNVGLAE
nr:MULTISPECIES: hypothetical protein [Nocardia]UEX23527.1 hypothetical protein LMJ57_03225 [Nocardia farcinica]